VAGDRERRWRWPYRDPAEPRWWRNVLYWLGGPVLTRGLAWSLLGGVEVSGRENIPAQGGAVIAPNHASHLDPPYVGSALPRRAYYMAKRELFERWGFGWIIYNVYAYPVERGTADRHAIRAATDLVRAGHLVLIFPEGTRSHDGQIGEGSLAPAMVAGRAGAPIIPAAVSGTFQLLPPGRKLPRRCHVRIAFGEPVRVDAEPAGHPSREALQAATDLLMQRLRALHAELEAKRLADAVGRPGKS
jgi:1-acyl-sn-glycerol-3-phosphate acyltransferase